MGLLAAGRSRIKLPKAGFKQLNDELEAVLEVFQGLTRHTASVVYGIVCYLDELGACLVCHSSPRIRLRVYGAVVGAETGVAGGVG